MTLTTTQIILTIAAVIAGTLTTRFLPFFIFTRRTPAFVIYLGQKLPYAVISLLIVFCIKDSVYTSLHGLPEIFAIILAGALHLWKKNILLSIAGSTLVYMLLVQHGLR